VIASALKSLNITQLSLADINFPAANLVIILSACNGTTLVHLDICDNRDARTYPLFHKSFSLFATLLKQDVPLNVEVLVPKSGEGSLKPTVNVSCPCEKCQGVRVDVARPSQFSVKEIPASLQRLGLFYLHRAP
jgi:hypothetical protein